MKTKSSIRTDLAVETREALGEMQGVSVEEAKLEGMIVSRVRVLDEEGSATMQKPIGTYVTVECPALPYRNSETTSALQQVIARELSALMPRNEGMTVLVVGLGNWNLTPDALGPKVVSHVLVTRHILEQMPGALEGRLRSVCAISPGVLGITGVETGEVVRGVVDKTRPDVVLCVDSLAARRTNRILTTVQMTDTGVQPGSGVGNRRNEISQRTLGVPVVAVGVPMVVHASTISRDAMEGMLETLKLADGAQGPGEAAPYEGALEKMLEQGLPRELEGLIVTPSGIDEAVEVVSSIVAMGINIALHPRMDPQEMTELLA